MTSLSAAETITLSEFDRATAGLRAESEKAKGLFARAKAWTLAEIAAVRARLAKPAIAPVAPSAASVAKVTIHHGVPASFAVIGGACLWFAAAHEQKAKDERALSEWNRAGMQQAVDAANDRDARNERKARQQQDAIDAYARELAANPKERTVYVQGKPVLIRDNSCLLGADGARRLRDILAASPRWPWRAGDATRARSQGSGRDRGSAECGRPRGRQRAARERPRFLLRPEGQAGSPGLRQGLIT